MVELLQEMRGSVEREILSNIQLRELEREVDKILVLADKLNPENPDDAEILYYEDIKLDRYISILEHSYKNARMEESGLKIIG